MLLLLLMVPSVGRWSVFYRVCAIYYVLCFVVYVIYTMFHVSFASHTALVRHNQIPGLGCLTCLSRAKVIINGVFILFFTLFFI